MKTPGFWYQSDCFSVKSWVLTPVAALYKTISRKNYMKSSPQSAEIPVVCVGNLVAGGSGKTPASIALERLLKSSNIASAPFFVTRGYKGNKTGPEQVLPPHDPTLWGDEALLLAAHAPTIVAKNRFDGAIYAQNAGADMVILDDGLQNYSLKKDMTLCVIDGLMGFGNQKLIPAGPLRQPLDDGFSLIDGFIFIGADIHSVRPLLPSDKPVFTARIVPRTGHAAASSSSPYVAFCGIGFPEKFKETLRGCGLILADFCSFPDHHSYTDRDINRLLDLAENHHARLITTEKDFVRLPDFPKKSMIDVLAIDLVFDDPDSVTGFIKESLS